VSATAPTRLEEAVTGGAIRSVNFFNGRLLTGDDLRREQEAERARLARLGRAAGEGIAFGLDVAQAVTGSTAERPVVTVEPGLAVARSGLALELPVRTNVSLLRDHPPAGAEPGGLFADCQPFAAGTYSAGAGVYLLTIGPARTSEGLAAVSGLTNDPAPCNTALSVEAVKFRLIRLALSASQLTDTQHLRNVIAYRFFGFETLQDFVADPFGPVVREYGLLDQLRAGVLTPDEVPLAVMGWTAHDGIRFVDLWSVRRRIARARAIDDWAVFADDRRRSEAEAMFLQFQSQLADLLHEPNSAQVRATERFTLLPSCGILPLAGSAESGIDLDRFFDGLKVNEPAFVEGQKLRSIVLQAFESSPIDLGSDELIWRYVVRENQQQAVGKPQPQPYVVFTNGFVPYAADAQFDLSHWDYASYAGNH
jgi:hypothetical protein